MKYQKVTGNKIADALYYLAKIIANGKHKLITFRQLKRSCMYRDKGVLDGINYCDHGLPGSPIHILKRCTKKDCPIWSYLKHV